MVNIKMVLTVLNNKYRLKFWEKNEHEISESGFINIHGLRFRYRQYEHCNSSFFLRQILRTNYCTLHSSLSKTYPLTGDPVLLNLLGITRGKRNPLIHPCGLREKRRHYVCPFISDEWVTRLLGFEEQKVAIIGVYLKLCSFSTSDRKPQCLRNVSF